MVKTKNAFASRMRNRSICACARVTSFFGENCSQVDSKCNNSYCPSNALCQPEYRGLIRNDIHPYCICASGHIGRRCGLFPDMCSEKPCQNAGRCIQKSKPNEFDCQCTEQYHGKLCEHAKLPHQLQIKANASLTFEGIVVQYLTIDFVTLRLTLADQQIHLVLPDNLTYFHETAPVPELVLVKIYHLDKSKIYVASLLLNQTSVRMNTSISERYRCQPAQSFFSGIIKYHHVCRTHHELVCFFDDIYLCICEDDHSRAECFNYDHTSDKCYLCLANGRCLKGRNNSDIYCICPSLSHRSLSVSSASTPSPSPSISSSSPTFSPRTSLIHHLTFYLLIICPLLLFLVGLLNNVCCFVTFRRPRCLRNGTGHYSVCHEHLQSAHPRLSRPATDSSHSQHQQFLFVSHAGRSSLQNIELPSHGLHSTHLLAGFIGGDRACLRRTVRQRPVAEEAADRSTDHRTRRADHSRRQCISADLLSIEDQQRRRKERHVYPDLFHG